MFMSSSYRMSARLIAQSSCHVPLANAILPSRTAHERSSLVIQNGTVALYPMWSSARSYTTRRFSRNMEFFSAGDTPIPKIKDSFDVSTSLNPSEERPLTILLCWLMSKDRYVKKYAKFYNDLGFDVLKVRASPFDVMRPAWGSQIIAENMLEFLHQNPRHSTILVHGFSAGCYVFCEALVKAAKNMDLHKPVLDRIVGQIWDSGVDLYALPDGIAKALTTNEAIQASIKKYLEWFLQSQYDQATVHYERASAAMNDAFLKTPALFLYSNSDTISSPSMNEYVYNNWAEKGVPVYERCFTGSPHVSHFMKYPAEYRAEVIAFMQTIGLLKMVKEAAL